MALLKGAENKLDWPIVRVIFICHPKYLEKIDMRCMELSTTRTGYVKHLVNKDLGENHV